VKKKGKKKGNGGPKLRKKKNRAAIVLNGGGRSFGQKKGGKGTMQCFRKGSIDNQKKKNKRTIGKGGEKGKAGAFPCSGEEKMPGHSGGKKRRADYKGGGGGAKFNERSIRAKKSNLRRPPQWKEKRACGGVKFSQGKGKEKGERSWGKKKKRKLRNVRSRRKGEKGQDVRKKNRGSGPVNLLL